MFSKIVTKESVRKSIGRKRLPRQMIMYISGAALYDILALNGEEGVYELMNLNYNIKMAHYDRKRVKISGSFKLFKGGKNAKKK